MRRKVKNVKFTDKRSSKPGIASLVISVFSLIWLVYALIRTFLAGDAVGNMLGGVGMLALVMQIVAAVLAVRSLREEDVFRSVPKAAAIAAFVLLLLWTAVYGLGIYAVLM